MLLLIISFVAGVLTVLAPCILPLLPVIVGGTLSEGSTHRFNWKKASTIIISLGASVVIFTLLLKASTVFIDIPEYVWKWISGGIVVYIGLATLFPSLWENKFLARLSIKANMLLGKGDQKNNFVGDVVVGAALGPVFSTCSPTYFIILATVVPVDFLLGLIYLLTYTFGLCISLLIVSIIGQKLMNTIGVAADPRSWFKKILGIVFLVVGLAILSGFDKKTQVFLLDNGFFDVTKIEQILLKKTDNPKDIVVEKVAPQNKKEVAMEKDTKDQDMSTHLTLAQKQALYTKAPELSSIDGYINTDGKPITLGELKGKVVLLDIWTYSCINCQRTLPYINDWYATYKDKGFVVVGLHTPEFAFERIQSNVEKAVQKFGITYPVVLDNDYSTWNALGNQFWPRKYLIDADGYIVYDHIGEGNYDETEKAIRDALEDRMYRMGGGDIHVSAPTKPKNVIVVEPNKVKSPEVYFGSSRNTFLGNGTAGFTGEQTFSIPSTISLNKLYLGGLWNIVPEYSENKGEASILFNYEAKNVYMAAGSAGGVEVEIYRDDVFVKKVMIKDDTLYPLIEGNEYGKHTLRIVVPKAGLRAFTFTFG